MTPGEVWLAYNAAENARDMGRMMALVADDLAVTVNGRPAVASARDDERAMDLLTRTYPDYRRIVDEVLSADDRAIARWRMRGTSPREGVVDLDVAGCSVVTVADGVMTQAYLYYDGAALDAVLAGARDE